MEVWRVNVAMWRHGGIELWEARFTCDDVNVWSSLELEARGIRAEWTYGGAEVRSAGARRRVADV